jgi:hypothetical protein
MKCKNFLFIALLLLLQACCECIKPCCKKYFDTNGSLIDVDTAARMQREKLRRHFIRHSGPEDISTLISETRVVSDMLKRKGRIEEANKFDSYIDVLTFGNRTIDESLNDVMDLVKSGK